VIAALCRSLASRQGRTPTSGLALHDTYVAAIADPVVRQKVSDAGAELLQSSLQEMADQMRKEAAKWAEVIRTANIQLD
jgi:tripartite-type tricarboxylate transporter receptor subunit TctC